MAMLENVREDYGAAETSPGLTGRVRSSAVKSLAEFFAVATVATSSILTLFKIGKADYQGEPRASRSIVANVITINEMPEYKDTRSLHDSLSRPAHFRELAGVGARRPEAAALYT
jgi:hypothetical protein